MIHIAAGVFAGIVGAVWFLGWLARRAERREAAHLTAAVKESFRQYYLTLLPAPPPPPAAKPVPAATKPALEPLPTAWEPLPVARSNPWDYVWAVGPAVVSIAGLVALRFYGH